MSFPICRPGTPNRVSEFTGTLGAMTATVSPSPIPRRAKPVGAPMAARLGLGSTAPAAAVDHRNAVGIDRCRAFDKAQPRQGNIIRRLSIQSDLQWIARRNGHFPFDPSRSPNSKFNELARRRIRSHFQMVGLLASRFEESSRDLLDSRSGPSRSCQQVLERGDTDNQGNQADSEHRRVSVPIDGPHGVHHKSRGAYDNLDDASPATLLRRISGFCGRA